MRTELRFGDVARELARQLGEVPGQMLILGVCEVTRLAERFGTLLESARWPVLIVRRENENEPSQAQHAISTAVLADHG